MLVMDCETTGLLENMSTRSELQPEIIEFCGLTLDPKSYAFSSMYDQLIKPRNPITEEITKINGITNEMVAKMPSFVTCALSIRETIERADIVVAHNAMFDVNMINLEFSRLGITKIAWPRIICTVEATTHLIGRRLRLIDLYEYLFKTGFDGGHRARNDVEALAKCFVELKRRGEI